MPGERDERLYVSDILTAVDRILAYTAAADRAAFLPIPRPRTRSSATS